MTNTEKYLDSIDGPADDDLFALDTDVENSVTDLDVEDDDDDLDFDSNYEDDRYAGNGLPAWSAWA